MQEATGSPDGSDSEDSDCGPCASRSGDHGFGPGQKTEPASRHGPIRACPQHPQPMGMRCGGPMRRGQRKKQCNFGGPKAPKKAGGIDLLTLPGGGFFSRGGRRGQEGESRVTSATSRGLYVPAEDSVDVPQWMLLSPAPEPRCGIPQTGLYHLPPRVIQKLREDTLNYRPGRPALGLRRKEENMRMSWKLRDA